MTRSSLALSNLRAVVIVIVLAFHSFLAYLSSAPEPTRFDQPPFTWESFPIVDAHRWLGFDIFCAWQDVSLMAMMFFLSGLLAGPSLERKGAGTYVIDRLKRIGLPFVFAALILSPLALYPAYAMRSPSPSLAGYWNAWFSLPYWPDGPQWFLWQLMAVNAIAALLYAASPGMLRDFRRFGAWASAHPVLHYVFLSGICIVGYTPLAIAYSPFDWGEFGPFGLQFCRPLLYIAMFFAGFGLGSYGLDRGLLSCDGRLARRWLGWTVLAFVSFFIWAGLTSLTFPDWASASLAAKIGASLAYPFACIAGGTSLLALFLRFSRTRARVLDSLSANAYAVYLVHYVFVVWLQYALLPADLPAILKAALVLTGTFVLSWPISIVVTRILNGKFAFVAKRPAWTPSR
jgi:membrane-bound acyltransferase YfiQ involved in biofilm formation